MEWLNEPGEWTAQGDEVVVRAGARTDFWRTTHYGFVRDNGHFYYVTAQGDFQADVRVSGEYTALYDQAGMMLRLDEKNWIKCGIEYVHGVQHASVVVTREFSDWSVLPRPSNPPTIWLRVKRLGDGVEVSFSEDGASYTLLRLAYFPPVDPVQVGLMCAAPDGDGFRVKFEDFGVRPL